MAKTIQKEEAISFGWGAMKQHLGLWMLLLFLLALIDIAVSRLIGFVFPRFLENFLKWVLGTMLCMVLVWTALRLHDRKPQNLGELLSAGARIGSFLVTQFLMSVLFAVGLFLLIFPAIYWATQFGLAGLVALDEGLGPWEAMKRSSALSRGARWELFLFGLLLVGVNLIGALALVVGLFASIPTSVLALVWVYRRLQRMVDQTAEAAPAPAATGV